MALSNKQRVFVEEYLKSWNATQAALAAGYSPKTARSQGQRLLTNVDIQKLKEQRIAEKAMTADEVLLRLAQQARGSLVGITILGANGEPVGFDLRDEDKLHLVKKVTIGDKSIAVELYDAQAALSLLGKHQGLFVERQDINLRVGDLDTAIERELAQLAGTSKEATPEEAGTTQPDSKD